MIVLKTGGGCSCFGEVNVVPLGEPFGNISDFVTSDVASIVTFTFANEFALERSLSRENIRARDEDKNIQVSQAFEFILDAGHPVFAFRRLKG